MLTFDSGPMGQTRTIIDDEDRTAKKFWEALKMQYATSNVQDILNLYNKLENIRFKENEKWEAHFNEFNEILTMLAAFGAQIYDEEVASKLITTLPESFSPLAMVVQTLDTRLENLVNAIEGELARRKSRK